MAYYKLETKLSPNYTKASDARRVYGRVREFLAGAGHWWGLWQAGYSHAGVVNTFLNPARQGSANEVISDRLVTLMVKYPNIAWTTNNANPFTYSYEVDPQIMHRWRSGATKAQKAKANRIFETVAQRMVDTGRHKKPWYPHKKWWNTACNDIRWNEIIARAKQIERERNEPAIKWISLDTPRKMVAKADVRVRDMDAGKYIGSTIKKGTVVDFKTKTPDSKWLRSAYSTSKKLNHGLERAKFTEVPEPLPEWVKNAKDIKPIKLMVLVAQTQVVDLVTGKDITPLGQGTWIDFTRKTVVNGKTYLISEYSAKKTMPNGILEKHVGIPPEPPKEKPEWLENWRDIKDVTMYARVDAPVVNLINGETVATVDRGTPVEISSATEWHDQEYLITVWATGEKKPHGIKLADLDMKPVDPNPPVIEPEKPNPIEDRLNALEKLVQKIVEFLSGLFTSFKK